MRVNLYPDATPSPLQGVSDSPKVPSSGAGSFAEELKSKIQEVNQLQNQADQSMMQGSIHGATNIHETMIQLEEADISLRLLTKVRNKAVDAYQEIMRMQF